MGTATATGLVCLVNGKPIIDATLDIEREQIDVTTMTEPDPNWVFIDASGHIHAYGKDFSLPTLKRVERVEETAPGDEFTVAFDDDIQEVGEDDADDWDEYGEADSYPIYELRCLICDEVVEPGSRATVGQRFKPGRYTWKVQFTAGVEDVLPLDRQRVSVWMTQDGKLKMFGIGLLSVNSIDPQGIAAGSIVGAGELGKR